MQLNLIADTAIRSFTPDLSAKSPGNLNRKASFEGASEVLEFAPDAIIVVDFSKKILFLNGAAERMFGYLAADLVEREFDVLVPAGLQPSRSNDLWDRRSLSDPENKPVEVVGLRQNGSAFAAEASSATVDDGNGEMRIFVLRDISDRKQTDTRNLRLADESAATSKVKELLLTELRHRMRNNLQTILSMIRLEKARPIGTEAKAELEQMENRIIALNGVDGELLASAETQSIELGGYVRRLAAALRNLFEPQPVPLYLSIQMEPIEVAAATAARIGLLINEAVTNSFKHAAPKGATEINLKLVSHDDIISIEIVDNGPGLADSPSRHVGGIDLMKQLVQQMGGTIQFDGQKGMRCQIEVPVGLVG